VTIDPGQQRIGSFHPITEGDWTEGAYISPETQKIATAIQRDDVAALSSALTSGNVKIDDKDANGRSPLHIAVLCNAIECTKFLISKEARAAARTVDGRTALHLAAQYGRKEIAELLIEYGKALAAKPPSEKKSADDGSNNKKKKNKKSGDDDDDDDGEDEDEDEDDGEDEDEEGGDGDDDDDEVDEESCIRAQVERKKQEALEELRKSDPTNDDEDVCLCLRDRQPARVL
jgi:Mg-chelatase subunit ChlI